MSFKPINSRQVDNSAALSNIGSTANATLDVILADINSVLGGLTSNTSYIANSVALTSGSTSYSVLIPTRPDLSYVVFAMFVNQIDSVPQFQQIQVTAKSTTGFTFSWNVPLASSNYSLDFILMPLWDLGTENAINSGASTVFVPLNVPVNGPNYGILGVMQNLVDTYPQFQTPFVINQSYNGFVETFNAPTSSSNYLSVYISNPTEQVSISSGLDRISVNFPVSYGSTGYAVLAVMSNTTDPFPLIQPIEIVSKAPTGFTAGWNVPVPTSNYLLTYYIITLTT